MKKLLFLGASLLPIASFLDALFTSGTGRPVHWGRDAIMAVSGLVCYILIIRGVRGSAKRPDLHL